MIDYLWICEIVLSVILNILSIFQEMTVLYMAVNYDGSSLLGLQILFCLPNQSCF